MNKQLRDAWVAALRSGQYKQGVGTLRKGDTYCCLGVLCEVAKIPYRLSDTDLSCTNKLRSFGEDAGLFDRPNQRTQSAQARLMEMNDNEGTSFPEIADWIEANVPVTP